MEGALFRFALLVILTLTALVRGEPVCSLNIENKRVTYDLSDLQLADAARITGVDLTQPSQPVKVYNYTLAVCRNVKEAEIPKACSSGSHPEEYAALQTSSTATPNQCVLLGKAAQSEMALVDPEQEAAGVLLRYKSGATCANGLLREFTLEVRCADVHVVKPVLTVELDGSGKPHPCHYRMVMESIHGCPVQCTVGPDAQKKPSLCSGRGLCGYDRSGQRARCFCDDGYGGHNCGEKLAPTAPSPSGGGAGTTALLVLLLLAAVGLFATVVYLASQIKAYRSDAQNYMQIRGTELVEQVGLLS